MTEPCPQMDSCSMFPLLKLSGSLQSWKERYCSGDHQSCERYKRISKGLTVAPDMLPNGVLLSERGGT